MQEFVTAVKESGAETAEPTNLDSTPVEFILDGRKMRAYRPHSGQLTFMMAAMGRGQSQQQRYAAIINIMMASLHPTDADYFEGRLLTNDLKERMEIEDIEPIFEYLVKQWFREESEADGEAGGDSQ